MWTLLPKDLKPAAASTGDIPKPGTPTQ